MDPTVDPVDEFVDRVQELQDNDYGDFKRKLDLALTRLWQGLGHQSREVDHLIYELKKKTVY